MKYEAVVTCIFEGYVRKEYSSSLLKRTDIRHSEVFGFTCHNDLLFRCLMTANQIVLILQTFVVEESVKKQVIPLKHMNK